MVRNDRRPQRPVAEKKPITTMASAKTSTNSSSAMRTENVTSIPRNESNNDLNLPLISNSAGITHTSNEQSSCAMAASSSAVVHPRQNTSIADPPMASTNRRRVVMVETSSERTPGTNADLTIYADQIIRNEIKHITSTFANGFVNKEKSYPYRPKDYDFVDDFTQLMSSEDKKVYFMDHWVEIVVQVAEIRLSTTNSGPENTTNTNSLDLSLISPDLPRTWSLSWSFHTFLTLSYLRESCCLQLQGTNWWSRSWRKSRTSVR